MVNVGEQNKPSSPPGRSILDYSLIVCFTLVILLAILVLDAFEYITVPRGGVTSRGGKFTSLSEAAPTSSAELAEVEKQIEEAKALLKEKHDEIEKLVGKVEAEIKGPAVETPAEQKEEEEKKEAVIEAVVEKELGITDFCGGCQYRKMSFTCDKRVSWMVDTYGITMDAAKLHALEMCHTRRDRGLRGVLMFNGN